MLKLENSIRGLSFSRVAFDLTIQDTKTASHGEAVLRNNIFVKALLPQSTQTFFCIR